MKAGAFIGGGGLRRKLRFHLSPTQSCVARLSGGDRARTDDPLLAKQVLSQLSYTPGGSPLGLRSKHRHVRRFEETPRVGDAAAPPPLSQFAQMDLAQTAVGVTLSCGKRRGGPGRI